MQENEFIPIDSICIHHQIETSFIYSLQEFGLIEITTIEEKEFVPIATVKDLEKYIRLHYELDINLEGIEAIAHLLKRMENIQHEILLLQNKLQQYEAF